MKRWSREEMARLVARNIPSGSTVNLGIGLPTTVARHVPAEREVLLHSENGVLGITALPAGETPDYDLINASKEPVSLRARAARTSTTRTASR
ncbi:3-oxoadipate CoA-transferase subunit B (plasmid) [Variovorax sp. WDL1]|nr:3-oxoadipate CoA-transferase subunit B [Variovorax sp. B2]PNG46264.1 3-oxoadipate CoA-transferase subunit B [Variovorax sp. B4]VTV19189.1 3-oxoadipate CoA-transferase subunit B [Variovorax sp. WDL1]